MKVFSGFMQPGRRTLFLCRQRDAKLLFSGAVRPGPAAPALGFTPGEMRGILRCERRSVLELALFFNGEGFRPPLLFSRAEKRRAPRGGEEKRTLGTDPWDPCFYRKATAQSSQTAILVQVGTHCCSLSAAAPWCCGKLRGIGVRFRLVLHQSLFFILHRPRRFSFSCEKKRRGGGIPSP